MVQPNLVLLTVVVVVAVAVCYWLLSWVPMEKGEGRGW